MVAYKSGISFITIMKIDCEVKSVSNPYYVELGDSRVACQEIIVRDFDVPHSIIVLNLWNEHSINYYNLQEGDKILVEFMIVAKKCKDGVWRNQQFKIMSITKHKPDWKPRNIEESDIYIIARADKSGMKIGRSTDVKKRVKQMQTANEVDLILIDVFPKWGYLEKDIHDALKEKGLHLNGEWYKYCQETYDIVAEMCG